MTKLQFERWQDFALRMARVCYADSRRPSGPWIVDKVVRFFEGIENDAESISSIINWDNSRGGGYCVSDQVSEYFDDDYFGLDVDAYTDTRQGLDRPILAWEQYSEQWMGPVHCCLRAGLDLASEPSMGVLGFTVGHIRKMYPAGVPDWIAQPDEPWQYNGEPVADVFAMAADTPLGL